MKAVLTATEQSQPLAFPVPQAAPLLGIGKTQLWELIASGTIGHVCIGRRVLVPRASIEEFLAARTVGGPS